MTLRHENGDEPFINVMTTALATCVGVLIKNTNADKLMFLESADILSSVTGTLAISHVSADALTAITGGTTGTAPTVVSNRQGASVDGIQAVSYTAAPTLTTTLADQMPVVSAVPREKVFHPLGARGHAIPAGGAIFVTLSSATLTSTFRIHRQ